MAEAWYDFSLTSKAIQDGGAIQNEQVYKGYGCSGKNLSPDLTWANPPTATKSFVIIMHDPDAPVQGGWWHWVLSNIPQDKRSLRKGTVVGAPIVSSLTSFGKPGYGGPCPPKGHGKHRYIFTIYALSVERIDSTPETTPEQIKEMVKPYIRGKASFMGYYERE